MPTSTKKSSEVFTGVALRLPEQAFSRNGVAFRPIENIWDWFDGPFHVHIDFTKLNLPADFPRDSLKHTLVIFAKGNSPRHVVNLFQAFVHYLSLRNDSIPLMTITVSEISNYAAKLQIHEKWRLGTLNVLLQKWIALGLNGLDPACAQYMRERRKVGNEKGAAVRTRNPVTGPFSEAEYTALYKAVDAAYGEGRVPTWVTVLTRLLFACGGRISQYASLKVKDLVINDDDYVLRLPQVKTGEAHSRVIFKDFSLSPQTGRLIQQHIKCLAEIGEENDAALFPERIVMTKRASAAVRFEGDLFYGHCTSDALSHVISRVLEQVAPPTERLDYEPIPVAPQRFRYTFGTRLAEEGASKAVIADQLGHVDLQNVNVYFEASPKIVDNIDKAMDSSLAPLARAFRGRLVENEEQSTQNGAPGSRIIDFRASKDPVGSCNSCGKNCLFNKPDACYTCFNFEPWLDGPHEKVLIRLQSNREVWKSDERLAAINDDAIRATREVIAECAEVRNQRETEKSL